MKTLLGLILALSIAAPAAAQEAQQLWRGLAALDRGDHATALGVLRPLAERGNAEAQAHLGEMYREGLSVPQDYAQALHWYRRSAEQGYALAQLTLGVMYNQGLGVPQDYAQAVEWYRKAAEQGDAAAQFLLGYMYKDGLGVPQDYVEAHKWLILAAARMPAEDERRANIVRLRDAVASLVTPAQMAEAQRLAREWKPSGGGVPEDSLH